VEDIYVGSEGGCDWIIMSNRQKVFDVINCLCSYCVLLFVYILTYYSMLYVCV
jgi:hypothetical protein